MTREDRQRKRLARLPRRALPRRQGKHLVMPVPLHQAGTALRGVPDRRGYRCPARWTPAVLSQRALSSPLSTPVPTTRPGSTKMTGFKLRLMVNKNPSGKKSHGPPASGRSCRTGPSRSPSPCSTRSSGGTSSYAPIEATGMSVGHRQRPQARLRPVRRPGHQALSPSAAKRSPSVGRAQISQAWHSMGTAKRSPAEHDLAERSRA